MRAFRVSGDRGTIPPWPTSLALSPTSSTTSATSPPSDERPRTAAANSLFLVGFEDQRRGGDRDYDDNVFQFTGNLAPKAPRADDHMPITAKPTPTPKPNVPPLKIAEACNRLPSVLREQ